MGKILVIGSSNTDLIAKVDRFPAGGETIEATSFLQVMGGKGANQAMAAHRLGGDVNFITCLGSDSYGKNALKYYQEERLSVSESMIVDDISSGTAMILVDKTGENCIVITPGANNKLSASHIDKVSDAIEKAELIVLQMEIPYETIFAICELASAKGKLILLNAAPARAVDKDLVRMVDILVVNETEAETISGKSIVASNIEPVVDKLLAMGPKSVILTLGENGCYMKEAGRSITIPAFQVEVQDSTGAGDTFCGAVAVGLSKTKDWRKVLEFATAASAICVTKMGAQPSLPTMQEVETFLNKKVYWGENGQENFIRNEKR